MKLTDRTGFAIVSATQEAFGPPSLEREEVMIGALKMETMFSWLPSRSLAEALFWPWLLQPERNRMPQGTAHMVRRILERQVRSAVEDVAAFANSERQ